MKHFKILLIEDNAADARLIEEMLLEAQRDNPRLDVYQLEHTKDLQTGLNALESNLYQVLLLDLSLPDSQGLDTFRTVQERHPKLPLIVLSGLDDRTLALQAVGEGAQDYLVKGQVDGNLISRSMHYAVERKRIEEEKSRFQEQLFQSQKMEAIGTLAGGVAHDFNNLMTAIQGFTDVVILKTDAQNPIMRALKQIRNAAASAADLTRQMLLFSRKHPTQFATLDVNRVVNDLLTMLHRVISEDIEILTQLQEELPPIWADRGTIEQIIMNLTLNARDAMPDGGKILIVTEKVNLSADFCKSVSDCKPGDHIHLSVKDDGTGIKKEQLEHIFEPFYSTKGPGKGTGLGLSVCYGIVKQHDGCIRVESEVGKGTTIHVYFPAQHKEAITPRQETMSFASLQGSGRRILLVEDSDGVREFAQLALTDNGYQVFSAVNVNEAVVLYQNESGKFDLVITDVVLPDQSGLELINILLSTNPKQKVLISSGYTDQKSQWPEIQEKGYPFLQKPYAYTDLLKTVRNALG